jgi:hypothetical protein
MTKPSIRSGSPARATASPVELVSDSPAGQKPPDETVAAAPAPSSTRRWRGRPKRRLLVALLGLLVIAGVVSALVLPQFLASNPSPTKTIWQSITSGISDGAVPKQTALEAFAYLYRVNIPGVTVPKGVDGSDAPTSGSGVVRWVQASWAALTPDQQAVVNRYLQPNPNDQIVPIDVPTDGSAATPAPAGTTEPTPTPAATAAVSASAAALAPQFRLLSVRKAASIPVRRAPDAPVSLADAMSKELATDIAHIGPKLGMAVLSVGSVAYPNIALRLSDTDGGNVLFLTQLIGDNIHRAPCDITAYKAAWEDEQATSSGGVSPRLHVLITHEVVHCYQNVIWDTVATADAIAPFITEGTAIYLAADDTGIQEPTLPGAWQDGYFTPEIALSNRTYDAVGFYSFLAAHGRDMWSLMVPAWQAAAQPGERSNAFIKVLSGDDPDIRDNWAESYLRRTDWGDPWTMSGFGLPDAAQVYQHPAQAQPAPGWTGSLLGRSNTVLTVTATSGEVVTVSTDGLASVHDDNGNSDTAFGSQRFCTISGGCVCPQGSLDAGQNMAPNDLSIPFVAAFNAPFGGSHYSVVGDKLDDLCGKPPTPSPQTSPTGPCGPNCASSNGDPHMLTVNHYRYDFQAAGEFTLLRSADSSLEIQARQEPYNQFQSVSIDTAVAARVGSRRVAVYASGGLLTAKVDGATADLTSPMDLGNGAQISAYPKGFEIDFSDGTKMWTLSVGQWGINVQIRPSASLQTGGVGLLGPISPNGMGVPALPDGNVLPVAADRHARHNVLYGRFADAWRVTDSTTLFDYDAGKSTATYTIEGYPADSADILPSDLTADQKAAGQAACAGVTDAVLHDQCVYDVAVTGETGFASNYQAIQSFSVSGIATPTPAPAGTGSVGASSSPEPTSTASGSVIGAVQLVQGSNMGGFALGPNDTAYISESVSATQTTLLEVDVKTGTIVHQVDVPSDIHRPDVPPSIEVHVAAGSVWLPGYKLDSSGAACTVERLDASTLAHQATISIPCTHLGPETISDGSALWFVDATKYDGGTQKGAVLTRIDPTTNAPGTSVALPFTDGYRIDSQGALFYLDSWIAQRGYYRLTAGAGAFESFGLGNARHQAITAGTGLWLMSDDGQSAQYFTAPGAPQATLPIPGTLVGGDSTAALVEVNGKDASGNDAVQLWRYPIDGSAPTMLGYSPTVYGDTYYYSGASAPGPIANADGVLTVWTGLVPGSQTPWVFLQWMPLK